MRAGLTKLYTGFARGKAAICAFCLLCYAALTAWAGGSPAAMLCVWAAAAVYVLAPGWLAMRLSRMAEGVPALALPLTVLFGTGFLAVCCCVAARFQAVWVLRAVPLVPAAGAAVCLLREMREKKRRGALRLPALTPGQRLLALLACTLIFLCGFSNVIKYAHPSRAGSILIDQDFLWMVGNAKSFELAFPSIDIRFYNVRFAYHYLTELLCAAFGIVTGLDCYDLHAYYLQPLWLAALVGCLYCLGRVFYGAARRDKALLFAFSPFVFSCASLWAVVPNGQSLVGNSLITHLLTNITSQATATVFLCIYCCLFFTIARQGFHVPAVQLVVLLCSFVMLTVAKGPVALIAGLGSLAAILFQLAQRRAGLKALAAAGAGALIFWQLYRFLFSASTNGSMSVTLTGTVERFVLGGVSRAVTRGGVNAAAAAVLILLWVAQLALMVPAAVIPWGYGLAGDLRRLFRLPPDRLMANACAGGGLLAYFLFNHPNYSQVYFFLTAAVFLNLLAVDQLDLVLGRAPQAAGEKTPAPPRRGAARPRGRSFLCGAARAGAAIGFATAALLYVHIGGSGILYFLRDTGVLARPVYTTTITADDEAAGRWLADNTPGAGTMFATNRIHSDQIHADGISNVYTAFSGRQAFMEGYAYVADSAPWMWVDERKTVNAALFSAATDADTLRALCAKYGITELVYSSQMAGDESQLQAAFPCVFSSGTVRIYRVS